MEGVLSLYGYVKAIKPGPASGRAASSKGKAWYTGMFVHGGVAGIRGTTTRLKWSTRYLVEAAKRITGHTDFTALGILEDMSNGCHKDSHNELGSENVVTLLKAPDCGGELWLEHEDLDPKYAEWKQVSRKLWQKGFVHRLEVGQPLKFQPRQWHEVQEWSGTRIVMVQYTPRLTKLHYQDKDALEFVGFQSEFFNDNLIHNNGPQTNDHVIHNNRLQTNDHVIHNNSPQTNDHVIHNNGPQTNDHVIHNNDPSSNGNEHYGTGVQHQGDDVLCPELMEGGTMADGCELHLIRKLETPERRR